MKGETILNESDIYDVFELNYSTITSNIQEFLGKGSGWITDSVIDRDINISKYYSIGGWWLEQTKSQEELQKLTKILQKNLISKT